MALITKSTGTIHNFISRYANRAKNIKNKPKINEDPKDALLREFQEEIARLKAALDKGGPGQPKGSGRKKRQKKKRIREGPDGGYFINFI